MMTTLNVAHNRGWIGRRWPAAGVWMLAVLLALAVGGCRARAREHAGPVEISLAGWGNIAEVHLLENLIAGFERDHPEIRVKFIHIARNYDPVLLTMVAGGKAPDIFYITPARLGDLLSKRVVMNLDPYLSRSKVVRLADFFPQTVEPYRWNGSEFGKGPIYGLCKDWSPDCLIFYNKKLFDEAGIPYPDGSWSRDEFVAVARKLTKRDDRGRIVQFGVYNNCIPEQWVWQSGGRYFSDDRKTSLLDSPECLDAMQFAADLSNKWHVAPGYAEQLQGAVNVMFETGRVAMCFYGQWFVPQFRENIKDFKWGVTTPPRHRRDVYLSGGMVGYGMYARTPHPDEAWKLMEFLVGPKGQAVTAKVGWNIPSSRTVAYGPLFRRNPALDPKITDIFLAASEKTYLFDRSPYLNPSEFGLYFQPQWEMVLLGGKSVREAMGEATRGINQAIKDNLLLLGEP